MQEAIRTYVPCMSIEKMKKKPMWMTSKILKSVKKKHRLWQRWKEHNDDNLELKYKKQANKAAKALRLVKRDFERKVVKNIKTDSKSFFS